MNTVQLSITAAAQGKELVYVDVSFEPLIQKFLSNRKKEVPAMEAALAALDFDKVRSISHGMKGAGGSYGLTASQRWRPSSKKRQSRATHQSSSVSSPC